MIFKVVVAFDQAVAESVVQVTAVVANHCIVEEQRWTPLQFALIPPHFGMAN
jgi:hypothetical protein